MQQALSALKNPRLWFSMAYALLAIVGVLSLVPAPEIDIEGSDKLMHFLTYFVLSACFTTLVRYNRSLIFIAVGLVAYGVLLEFLQGLTGYRFMEVYDVLANSIGVITGLSVRFSAIP
ncbi:MAG: VanZ family protein, partial [Gammaproteobacteria bacterium]|nr:VanZ family protein [Gammaproteobacteria bacterium]